MGARFQVLAALFLFSSMGITISPAQQISSSTPYQNEVQDQKDNAELASLIVSEELNSSEEIAYKVADDRFRVPNDDDEEILQNSTTISEGWSIWYFIFLTVIVGSILIYLYLEHGRKVVAVRQEMNKLKLENEKLKNELAEKVSELEQVVDRLKKAEEELDEKSRKAGMAEIAAGVLHNVANVLSSVNSSNTFIQDTAKYSKVDGLVKANKLLREHIDNIDQFIFDDPRGKKLLNYYLKLEEPLRKERQDIVSQSERLDQKISIISDVITAQQSHAFSGQITSETELKEIVESTLSLQEDLIEDYKLKITTDLKATTPVIAQRSKLIHVLVNFIKNAGESMEENQSDNKKLTIRTWEDSYKVYLSVTDNGMGIKNENLNKIFSHTYTTKRKGHGFGLHSSANYMKEMGGRIEVTSEGRGMGTTFTLVFPIVREHEASRA